MPLVLLLAFLVVPIVELAVIVQVGDLIGFGWTLVLLLAMSVAGAMLVRREGTRAWRRFREAIAEPRLPTHEVVDGALVVLGGALMLTPGFVTDVVGLLLVIPVTRSVVARLVRRQVRVVTLGGPAAGRGPRAPRDPRDPRGRRDPRSGPGRPGRRRTGPRPAPLPDDTDESVVDVEVVSIEREPRRDPDRKDGQDGE